MNKNFLNYYNNELFYLREAAEEFAAENPHIAQKLSLRDFNCTDPYIERLLEAFAYMAARVHYQLDSEFLTFTQSIINNIYPDYLMPVPSASIVKFQPDFSDESIAEGVLIPRNTKLTTRYRSRTGEPCTFTTAYDVKLLPIVISDADYIAESIFSAASIGLNFQPNAVMKLSLETVKGIKFSEINNNELTFHITGASNKVLMDLHQQLLTDVAAVIIEYKDSDTGKSHRLKLNDIKNQIKPVGFDENEALLPINMRSFNGFRLLKEYFAFPKKFHYFRLINIADVFKHLNCEQVNICFVFNDSNSLLENNISKKNFSLYTTPVINLFKKRLDRYSIDSKKYEHIVNADKTKIADFEILKVLNIEGYNAENNKLLNLKPFYKVSRYDSYDDDVPLYYIDRKTLIDNKRSRKKGTDTFLSVLDVHDLYTKKVIAELSIDALCSNRFVPTEIIISSNSKTDFTLGSHFPVESIKFTEYPTKPSYFYLNTNSQWDIVNHLKVSHNKLLDSCTEQNTELVKDLIKLYANIERLYDRKQINGLVAVEVSRKVMRVSTKDGVSFGSGLVSKIIFDDKEFSDNGYFILGYILCKIINSYLPINTISEVSLDSKLKGTITKWITKPI